MKIGILTQPLHTNYGGLLQAYAMQRVLNELGHEAWIIRICRMEFYQEFLLRERPFKVRIKHTIKRILGLPRYFIPTQVQSEFIGQNTKRFIDSKINPKTELITSAAELFNLCNKVMKFEGYVAGSDQVWRPMYSPNIPNFFLDFAQHKKVKRVAYAASFGVDKWEFTNEETKECAPLAQLFDAVSVREDSGIQLCKEHLGVEACHVLDPTMLLEREDYETLVREDGIAPRPGNLFCYVLDISTRMEDAISIVASQTKLIPFRTMPKNRVTQQTVKNRIEDCVYPPVTAWLRSFMDAEFVVTDSFHGCVFSIIFNKPFVVLGNESRGQARFSSLLKIFGLESRFCSNKASLTGIVNQSIDWERVNALRQSWQKKSFDFLRTSLS